MSLLDKRLDHADKAQQRTCYLLWGQYSDYSGQVFLGVYGTEEDAKAAKKLIGLADPGYQIKIDPVEWRYK